MTFARRFFDLQFSFAETARALSGQSIEAALLDYTNFHVRFGFGRDFDADGDGWQQYLAGLRSAEEGRDWTYRFYLTEPEPEPGTAPRVEATFGCFSYARPDGRSVRLHFRNADSGDDSPLREGQTGRRRAELAMLFAHLKRSVGPETPIVGVFPLQALRVTAAAREFFDFYGV
jgi:hypothetical protein